jgi:capsular exopolysaccharide synthesis family protein
MNEERHHATMRDYLFALRRRKFVIFGVMLVAALAAAALAFLSGGSYTAQASLNAQPPAQNAGLAGLLQTTQQLPTVTSAQLEQTITRPEVLQLVKSELHLTGSLSDIANNISTSTDAQSNFVLISGTASTAEGAARFTNAVANAVSNLSNSALQIQYARLAVDESKAAAALLSPFKGLKITQLTDAQAQAQTDGQNASRLQTFSKVVNVAQVEALATVPSGPNGPHLILNIILGLVVGLLLGLLLTWFLESFDRRLRRPDETESLLGMPVVGVVQTGGLGKAPSEADKNATSVAAFRMMRTNVRFLSPDRGTPPRAVLVTSAISEEGKTTVAMGLALSSAAAGLNTLLIEADTHRPAHAKRLGLATGPGLADYLTEGLSPDKVLQVYPFTEHAAGAATNGTANGRVSKLTCITAGNVGSFSGDALGSQRFADVINEVKQVYDLVVIDSAPLLAVAETSELVAFVDAVVFCVRMGRTTAEQARAARAALQRLPQRLGGLVLTDLQRNVGGYYGYAYGYGPDKAATAEEAAVG